MQYMQWLSAIYAMIILNNLANTGQRMEQEKNTTYWWKITDKRQYTLFFIRLILKEQWDLLENKNKIRTIKAEINTKNFLSKFGKDKCTVINKYQKITRWGVISTSDEQNFDKYCSSV